MSNVRLSGNHAIRMQNSIEVSVNFNFDWYTCYTMT